MRGAKGSTRFHCESNMSILFLVVTRKPGRAGENLIRENWRESFCDIFSSNETSKIKSSTSSSLFSRSFPTLPLSGLRRRNR